VDIESLEAIRGELNALELRSAIIDGINGYLRDVLKPRGFATNLKDFAGSRLNDGNYEIALRVALKWLGPKNRNA
jgi:hypothetical protein